MKLPIIINCEGCGATMIPVHADTAWLKDDGMKAIESSIRRHRLAPSPCPYFAQVNDPYG